MRQLEKRCLTQLPLKLRSSARTKPCDDQALILGLKDRTEENCDR